MSEDDKKRAEARDAGQSAPAAVEAPADAAARAALSRPHRPPRAKAVPPATAPATAPATPPAQQARRRDHERRQAFGVGTRLMTLRKGARGEGRGTCSDVASDLAQHRRHLARAPSPRRRRWAGRRGRAAAARRARPALERLDGRLALDHGRHDVAVLGGRLLAHDDPVAVGDGRVDHRVAGDLEQEQRAVADQRGSGKTSSTSARRGSDRRRRSGRRPARTSGVAARRVVADSDARGAAPGAALRRQRRRPRAAGWVAPHEALALEHGQLVRDARSRESPAASQISRMLGG